MKTAMLITDVQNAKSLAIDKRVIHAAMASAAVLSMIVAILGVWTLVYS